MTALLLFLVCLTVFWVQPDWALNYSDPSLSSVLTCQFYHEDAEHLTSNMVVLLAFGWDFERRFGRLALPLFCLGAGTLALVLESLFHPEYLGIIFGASTFTSALTGAYMRDKMHAAVAAPLIFSILFDALWGSAQHAHVAHISGVLIGLAFTQLAKGIHHEKVSVIC